MSLEPLHHQETRLAPVSGGLKPFEARVVADQRNGSVERAQPGAVAPEDLLEAIARRRDREAFKLLFADFAPRLKAFARRMSADGQVAEDLAQDVMLTVWRRAGQFDRRKAGAGTWIFTIARNRRIDMIRRETRPEVDPEDPALGSEGDAAADEQLARRRRDEALHRAVARLPEEQSQLMRLAYFEDKTHGVIADELNLPLGTVKSRIRLAMRKLRQMVKDED
jgi:RNA polymerase sigma-70 factor, ECF subfamily